MTNNYTITATMTVAASAAAATTGYASLTYNPAVTAVVSLQVPSTQVWLVQDVYILASANAGTSIPIVSFLKNFSVILGDTPPLSVELITNNTRPPALSKVLGYGPVETMQNLLTTTVANDATADSIKYYITAQVNERK